MTGDAVDLRPSLYRVGITALIIAAAANILLWRVTRGDDTFASIIAVTSGVVAVGLIVTSGGVLVQWRQETLLLAFSMWTANAVEFWLQNGPSWESRLRQCGFYAAFAVLALGTWLAQRVEESD